MANVELVIKIPEDLYEAYKGRPSMLGDAGMDMIAQAISKGKALPKEHGNLVDVDAVINSGLDKGFCNWYDEIKYAKPIIRANKEE